MTARQTLIADEPGELRGLPLSAYKVLIADDDKELRKLLELVLRREGYQVIVAGDSFGALRRAVDDKPDLLLLDVHMPAGEGFSVQERLQGMNVPEGTPVVYFSGDRSDYVASTAAALGAFSVLHKPFSRGDVLATVRAALLASRPAA